MSATPLASPDVHAATWNDRLRSVAAYVEDNIGRLPHPHSIDPAEARLGDWWAQIQAEAGDSRTLRRRDKGYRERIDKYRAVLAIRDRAFDLRVGALSAYALKHEGRFPPNRSDDPETAELGCWWVSQNIELTRRQMSAEHARRLDALRDLADARRAAVKALTAVSVSEAARERARAVTMVAGAAGAVVAAEALKSPYLIPGDAKVLQLRIDNPDKTLAELAALAKLSPGRFATKYYGALHRGPNSRTPLRKAPAARIYAPGEAADLIGVPRLTLTRWANAGLVASSRNKQGHRRYLGAEVLRVKGLIADGWPTEYVEAAGK